MKFKIRTRDWKGSYDDSTVGWKLFASVDKIVTGQDAFAEIYVKGNPPKISGQEVWNIYESLLCGEDVKGYALDEKDEKIVCSLNA